MNTVYKTLQCALKVGWRTVEQMQESGAEVKPFLLPNGLLRYRTDDGHVTFLVEIKDRRDERGRLGAAVPMFLPPLDTGRKCFPTQAAATAYLAANQDLDLHPEQYKAYTVPDGREVTVWVLYDRAGRCLYRDYTLR